jgi:ArsR family transcriptional regulator
MEFMRTAKGKSPKAKQSTKTARLSHARRAAILKALADPRRFELLECIASADCPLGCASALQVLDISPATLSHHVKELEAAGLVYVEREGKFIHMTLRTEVWKVFLSSLGTLAQAPRKGH